MTIERMRTFLALAVLVGCNGRDDMPDAAPPDTAPTLDCPSYCAKIEAGCTGENAQYPDMKHCMAACASFPVGTSTVADTSGNTLGCRIYHAGASRTDPTTHCAHAGPAGDHLTASPAAACSGGDVCASYCALQIKACGSVDAPLPGDPIDSFGNPLYQYQNIDNCMTLCAGYNKTHSFRTTSMGDSLACRLLYTTRAAIDLDKAKTECRHTGFLARGPCEGTPMP